MPPLRRLGKYILGTRIAFCDNGERMTEQSYETWKDYFPCIGIAILLGARLPNMGELSTETKIHKFFANPIVQGVGVFLALALAFSGKLSQVGTRVCIVLAACVGIWGIWSHVRSKRAAIFLTVVYIAALLWFAKFLTQSTTATAAPHPLITVKIHHQHSQCRCRLVPHWTSCRYILFRRSLMRRVNSMSMTMSALWTALGLLKRKLAANLQKATKRFVP